MNRCPKHQRRVEGKCVYKTLYDDCRQMAKHYRKHDGDLKVMIDNLNVFYNLDQDTIDERYEDIGDRKKIRWDDIYYVMLGAGEGW